MKNLFQKALLLAAIMVLGATNLFAGSDKEMYEWRYYKINDGCQEELDSFFKDVLIPAYERQDVKTAVFQLSEAAMTEKQLAKKEFNDNYRFVLFIYDDIDEYQEVKDEIWKDRRFTKDGAPYFEKWATAPAYQNMESFLCEAFDKMPKLKNPSKNHTQFELRNYRSANEEAGQRKVKMFNDDEMQVFKEVDINMVCFGEVLSGPVLPSLIYLTSYPDNAQRKAAWKRFGANATWNRIKSLPEYSNTVIKNRMEVVELTPYSRF